MRKTFISCFVALSLVAGSGIAMSQSTAKEDAKKAGEATKDAGKSAGEAAKQAGKATAKATKTGAKKVKKAVTGDAHATCVDGTRSEGKTEAAAAAACASHGGVAKQ